VERVSVERMEELFEKVKNWGRWGADDERGTLNLLTPEHTAAAARNVVGRTVSCGRPSRRRSRTRCRRST
jgi:hypothetical protein